MRQLTLALNITANGTAIESLSTSQNQNSENDTAAVMRLGGALAKREVTIQQSAQVR
jgi:hypothetical protein